VLLDAFRGYCVWLHRMTTDFMETAPEDRWEFTPESSGTFGSFARQLRHVVRVRGVYNDALVRRRWIGVVQASTTADRWSVSRLLHALHHQQQELLSALDGLDPELVIDWDGTPSTLATFTWEFVQHEAFHHGQWSLYAVLAGFGTPESWRRSWRL